MREELARWGIFERKEICSARSSMARGEFLTAERKSIERAETWFLFAWGTRYVHSFLLVSHYSLIFHNIMLFRVNNEGHQSACWSMTLQTCLPLFILIWYVPVVVMKCLRVMRVAASDMVYPPAQKIYAWFMKWIFWYFPLFIHLLLRSVSLLPLFLDVRYGTRPISHPRSKEILKNLG